MGTTREDVLEAVKYVEVITPLSNYSEKSERRKAKARERLENAWGRRWEAKLGDLMPPWPAEGFMRELAVFAESNGELNVAKVTMKHIWAANNSGNKTGTAFDPAQQLVVVQEVSKQIEEFTEKVAFAAEVQKEIIDSWTDQDYNAMGTTREEVQDKVKYTNVITPLSIYSKNSGRRKARARDRLVNAWGRRWEAKLGEMMPPWPVEGFMRELAVFAESNGELNIGIGTMQARIVDRLAAKRTRKDLGAGEAGTSK